MSTIQYKLHQLTSYLGVKKMKQLGFIECHTCKKILGTASQFNSFQEIKNELNLTPMEQFEKFNTIYSLAPVEPDSTNSSSANENTDTPEATVTDLSNMNVPSLTQALAEQPQNASPSSSNAAELLNTQIIASNSTDTPKPAYFSEPYRSPQTEKQLIDAFINAFNALNITYKPSSHEVGYIYDLPAPSVPNHTIMCPECGKLYEFTEESHQIKALPVQMTDVEYEMIKGVYVDILL